MNLNNISGLSTNNLSDLSISNKSKLEGETFSSVLNNAIENKEEEKLKQACVEFESYFINMMFKSMRNTIISSDGILKKSNAEKIFQEMLDEEMSKDVAKSGGIGLADMIYKELSSKVQ